MQNKKRNNMEDIASGIVILLIVRGIWSILKAIARGESRSDFRRDRWFPSPFPNLGIKSSSDINKMPEADGFVAIPLSDLSGTAFQQCMLVIAYILI